MKKRIIVSVTNDLYTDQRVHKVCCFLTENNYQVLLVGRKKRNSPALETRAYKTKRMCLLFEKGPLFYFFFNLRLFLFLSTKKCDAYLSNDLDTLLANYLAQKIHSKRELFYDTHEYFTEVPELLASPTKQKIWTAIEKWIFPKLKNVYTVNDSIANIYREKYKVKVEVVRNIAPGFKLASATINKSNLKISNTDFCIILQGAGINVDRGAEELIEAMKLLDNTVLLIVGDGDVVPQIKQNVKEYGLEEKIRFLGKKPYLEMMQYTNLADVGVTLDKNTNDNYKYSLPNKLFDYIHAETPVIATDLVEISKIVNHYEVGIVLEELSAISIANAVNSLKDNPEILKKYKMNCKKAALELNWENECQTLKKIYNV